MTAATTPSTLPPNTARRVAIDPLSRVEGHGKVTLLLDQHNRVRQARLHIVEFRGFEAFIVGRPYWEVPVMVQRLCGICPGSHHLAASKAIDAARHPALFMVDTISSLACLDYRHDEWGVDVTVGGSQKGLMLPPGLSFNAISEKALAASKSAALPRSYWAWDEMLANGKSGYFPYTPATNLLYGLREALTMLLDEEGLENVFARHQRHAEATRRAVRAWGLEVLATNPAEYSGSLTAVLLPPGHDADRVRQVILEHFDMSLGTGLGKLQGKVFRIGHLGDFNDLALLGTLAGVEMGLALAGVPAKAGGVQAAMGYLAECRARPARAAA